MDIFYKLIPIFIVWELLSLFGVHARFSKQLSDFKVESSTPGEIGKLLLGFLGFILISFGYIIWALVGLIMTPQKVLFLLLIVIGIPISVGKNEKINKIFNILDPVVSILILLAILLQHLI